MTASWSMLNTKPEIVDSPDAVELKSVRAGSFSMMFSFSYNDKTEVLKNINLRIEPRQTGL